MNKINIFGCNFNSLTLNETIKIVENNIGNKTIQGCGVNIDQLIKMNKNSYFNKLINKCELILADGTPIVWMSRFFNKPLPERVPAIDLYESLLPISETKGYKIFILGAKEEILQLAIKKYKFKYPNLKIVGFHNGYYADNEETIAKNISKLNPDFLFIAMSSPRKELFVDNNRQYLSSISFILGIGGSIDIAAGLYKRSPKWLSKIGLEWFYRFLQEPKRMFSRYFVHGSYIFILFIKEILKLSNYRKRNV